MRKPIRKTAAALLALLLMTACGDGPGGKAGAPAPSAAPAPAPAAAAERARSVGDKVDLIRGALLEPGTYRAYAREAYSADYALCGFVTAEDGSVTFSLRDEGTQSLRESAYPVRYDDARGAYALSEGEGPALFALPGCFAVERMDGLLFLNGELSCYELRPFLDTDQLLLIPCAAAERGYTAAESYPLSLQDSPTVHALQSGGRGLALRAPRELFGLFGCSRDWGGERDYSGAEMWWSAMDGEAQYILMMELSAGNAAASMLGARLDGGGGEAALREAARAQLIGLYDAPAEASAAVSEHSETINGRTWTVLETGENGRVSTAYLYAEAGFWICVVEDCIAYEGCSPSDEAALTEMHGAIPASFTVI